MLISYVGAQSYPGHPRITSWDFGLRFKKPFHRHRPSYRRLVSAACLWRCPKFCICKEENENQRKPPSMVCHESGSSDTNSSSPMKEWQNYGSQENFLLLFSSPTEEGGNMWRCSIIILFPLSGSQDSHITHAEPWARYTGPPKTSGNKTLLLTMPSPELMTHLCLFPFRFMWVS